MHSWLIIDSPHSCIILFQTTADIAEADRKRREEFKEYEMQKEFEKQEKLRILDEEHKKQLLKDIEDKNAKHKQHDPVSAECSLFVIYCVK